MRERPPGSCFARETRLFAVKVESMIVFLFSILLFFMLIAGALSLLFASKSLISTVWNFMWYFLIGIVAIRVFGPNAAILPLIFGTLYLWRVLKRKRAPNSQFAFRTFRTRNGQATPPNGWGHGKESPSRQTSTEPNPQFRGNDVIDVEFTKNP